MSSLPSSPSSTSSAPITASASLSAPGGGYEPRLRSDTGSRSEGRRHSAQAQDRKRRFANPGGEWNRGYGHASGSGPGSGSGYGSSMDRGQVQGSRRSSSGLPPGRDQTGSYGSPIDVSSPDRRRPARQGWPQQGGDYMEYFLPRWQPDEEVTECPICGTAFSFWYRKHHCRKCGRVVCASCSPHRITIPRQFIVRQPDFGYGSGTSPTHIPSHLAQAVHDEPSPSAVNPALGGGEEVRLCNPCVPDPNPDPPRGYVVPHRHRAHHSMSAARSPYGVFRPARRTVGSHDYPDIRGFINTGLQEGYPGPSPYSAQSLPRLPQAGPSSWFSRYDLSEPPQRPHRRRHIDEREICPICNRRFRPLSGPADEEAREEHIRECIENHGPQARGSSPRSPSQDQGPAQVQDQSQGREAPTPPVRLISYAATEKDCLGQDGGAQECTICMEEYEVGQALVRLECLCKFHRGCIAEWFGRKKECPVHKVS